jgi:hypothetical protein
MSPRRRRKCWIAVDHADYGEVVAIAKLGGKALKKILDSWIDAVMAIAIAGILGGVLYQIANRPAQATPAAVQAIQPKEGWVKAPPEIVAEEDAYNALQQTISDESAEIQKLPRVKKYRDDLLQLKGREQEIRSMVNAAAPGFTVNVDKTGPNAGYGYLIPLPKQPAPADPALGNAAKAPAVPGPLPKK